MSGKMCQKCGKTAGKGNLRSHSNVATNRRFGANLQKKKIDGKSLVLCTVCIKTLSKVS